MKAEIARRSGRTEAIVALFRSRPLQYIGVHELAHVGGFAAWRTRCSDARKRFEAEGGSLIWNGNVLDSQYMFHPHAPIGRPADVRPTQQPGLFS